MEWYVVRGTWCVMQVGQEMLSFTLGTVHWRGGGTENRAARCSHAVRWTRAGTRAKMCTTSANSDGRQQEKATGMGAPESTRQGIYYRSGKRNELGAEDDEGAFYGNQIPEALPNGTPRHVFRRKRDESVLSSKLMLWGGWKGIVSFEGMLDRDMKVIPVNCVEDVRFLLGLNLTSFSKGSDVTPLYRFVCVTQSSARAPRRKRYTAQQMPSGMDIVRELRNEQNFWSDQQPSTLQTWQIEYHGNTWGCNDFVHTNREVQLLFCTESEVEQFEDDEVKQSGLISVESHNALRNYVLNKHVYYAGFHTQVVFWDTEIERACDDLYAFAVGVSPHSGNLVGVFGMQSAHNLTN